MKINAKLNNTKNFKTFRHSWLYQLLQCIELIYLFIRLVGIYLKLVSGMQLVGRWFVAVIICELVKVTITSNISFKIH